LSAEILATILSGTTAVAERAQPVRLAVQPRVSIIIPAYNEAARLISRLEGIDNFFRDALGKGAYEFIVVTDGCLDETVEIAQAYAKQSRNLKTLDFPRRLGKGGAIIQALDISRGDPVVLLDADDSVPPESVLKLIEATKDCDLAMGSRYVSEARLHARAPFLRFLLSRAFNVYVKLMFPSLRRIHDTQCGAKVVRRSVIDRIRKDLFITDFVFDINLIVSALQQGFVVKEIGIRYEHIENGSKLSGALARFLLLMFFSVVRLRFYCSRYRRLLEVGGIDKLACHLWNVAVAQDSGMR
jgi:glycosyltransferase involved in cell wall biosynthesis